MIAFGENSIIDCEPVKAGLSTRPKTSREAVPGGFADACPRTFSRDPGAWLRAPHRRSVHDPGSTAEKRMAVSARRDRDDRGLRRSRVLRLRRESRWRHEGLAGAPGDAPPRPYPPIALIPRAGLAEVGAVDEAPQHAAAALEARRRGEPSG